MNNPYEKYLIFSKNTNFIDFETEKYDYYSITEIGKRVSYFYSVRVCKEVE